MHNSKSPLDLSVPRNKTALMQHLQLLVGREGYRYWCGGTISREKFPAFAEKMSRRYPITRSTPGRSYDRIKHGKAVVHFISFPVEEKIQWWLLSDGGTGGLADDHMEDSKVAKDAMAADAHITFGDYVLLYASKRERREVKGNAMSPSKTFYKDLSTWTWKMRGTVVKELRASIEECCSRLQLGFDGGPNKQGRGLKGLLSTLRRRPLFSGIRIQVRELHQDAIQSWRSHHNAWRTKNPSEAAAIATTNDAGLSLAGKFFPTLGKLPVYDNPPKTMRELCTADTHRESVDGDNQ